MSQRNRRRTKKLNNKNNNNNYHINIKNNRKYKCDCKHCTNALFSSCKQYIINNLYGNTSPYKLLHFHFVIDLILFIFGALYIVFVPYTKMEESFNMQATHDMLFYGYFDTTKYNHIINNIMTPQTFISSLFLSLMVYPWKFIIIYILPFIFNCFDSNVIHFQQQCQYLIRFTLLFVNIIALSKFRQSFIMSYFVQETDINKHNHAYKNKNNKRHNKILMIQKFSLLFTVLIISQFHFLFYSSRLLPNCLTLPCITIAFAYYFEKKYKLTFIWLILSTIIFQFHTVIILIPLLIIVMLFKIQNNKFKILLQLLIYAIITSLICITFAILTDSWFWNRFTSIKWVQFELLSYNKSYTFDMNSLTYYFFSLIPKILLVNTFFMFLSIFKIHPLLLIYEFANRYSSSRKNIYKLFSLFIDLDSLYILIICFIFIFFNSFLPSQPIGFIYCIIPPCTLLSCIGCIRLFTLWGFTGISHANYNLLWHKNNLYIRQKELYYLWIPNNLLISSIVKKLLSFDTPITPNTFKKYFKIIFKEIPKLIFNSNIKIKLIPLIISITIAISMITTWYNVYQESYNYPGGVAITVFPNIVSNYNNTSALHNNSIQEEQYKHIRRRAIHSQRGHPMNRDYKTITNASKSIIENKLNNINCVHICNKATESGVSPFMIPSFYNEFKFTTLDQIGIDEYINIRDPCNIYNVYNQWDDDIYDEEYFDNNPITHISKGFDYLITEHSYVPGYMLIPNGIIYAQSIHMNLIHYLWSFIKNTNKPFLQPTLYVLKRQRNINN